jgi:hypothetical protein
MHISGQEFAARCVVVDVETVLGGLRRLDASPADV